MLLDMATAKGFVYGGGDWRVHSDEIALDGLNDTLPLDIPAARFPDQTPVAGSAAEFSHAEAVYPGLRARTQDAERIAGFKTGWSGNVKAGRTDGDVVIPDVRTFGEQIGMVVLADDGD